jgi:hypothetical protein
MSLNKLVSAIGRVDAKTSKFVKFNEFTSVLAYSLDCHDNLNEIRRNPSMYARDKELIEKLFRILDSFEIRASRNQTFIYHNYITILNYYKDIANRDISPEEMILCKDVFQNEKSELESDDPWRFQDLSDDIHQYFAPYMAVQIKYLREVKSLLQPYLDKNMERIRLKPEIGAVEFGLIMRAFINCVTVNKKGTGRVTARVIQNSFMNNDGTPIAKKIYNYLNDTTPYEKQPSYDTAIDTLSSCIHYIKGLRNKILQN